MNNSSSNNALSRNDLSSSEPMSVSKSARVGPPLVNLLGYDTLGPKRFVVPGASDGTAFQIVSDSPNREVCFAGTIAGQAGIFSSFQPARDDGRYVVEVAGHGHSRPFAIAPHLLQRSASRLAYQHFIDVRGHTDPKFSPAHITGGGPSRDGGGATLEATFELLLYASNPGLFDRWTNELPRRDMPDLVELALWHAEFCHAHHAYSGSAGGYENMIRRFGYAGGPTQAFDAQNLLDQLAAVCAAYGTLPGFKQHFTRSVFGEYRRVCMENWENFDRHREVRYWVESDKWIDQGRREFNEQGNAFGQGLIRNLLMWLCEASLGTPGKGSFLWYDIALGGDPEPDRFLGYAKACCLDILGNWNLDDPWHNWALRNAEHITPQALGLFLLLAPEHAPAGVREKLRVWADRTIERSDNLWHYRTHSETEWAHPKSKEIGTIAGLAGSLFLVGHLLEDSRLTELAWSNVGFLFGCNPVGRVLGSASILRYYNGGLWPGIDLSDYWPDSHPMGTGRLGGCRGTFEGSPIDAAFPYSPEHFNNPAEPWYSCEGWVLTNRAWLAALAFSTLGKNRLTLRDALTNLEIKEARTGQEVVIELTAPISRENSSETLVGVWEHHQFTPHELILREQTARPGVFTLSIRVPTCPQGVWHLRYGGWGLGAELSVPVAP